MAGGEHRSEVCLEQFSVQMQKLCDKNGGIAIQNVSPFHCLVAPKRSLIYIQEAIEMLNKSDIEVFENFVNNFGWKLINKWLIKTSKTYQPPDDQRSVNILKLILEIIDRWLDQSNGLLNKTTWKLIQKLTSTDEEAQEMIQNLRLKLANQLDPGLKDQQPLEKASQASENPPNIYEPISKRLRKLAKTVELAEARRLERDADLSFPSKRSGGEKSIQTLPEVHDDVQQSNESNQSEVEDTQIVPESGAIPLPSPTNSNSSKYEPTVVDHSHGCGRNGPLDMVGENSSYTYYRRIDLIKKISGGNICDIETTDLKPLPPVIINMPGVIQNIYYGSS